MCVEVKGQLASSGPFLPHMRTRVVRFRGRCLYIRLAFERRPCSLSHPLPSTPACHRPQNLLWTHQRTHVDRHIEFPGLLAQLPVPSGQAWEEGILRPDPPPFPCSRDDTSLNISDVCLVTDLSLRLGSSLTQTNLLLRGNSSGIPQLDKLKS